MASNILEITLNRNTSADSTAESMAFLRKIPAGLLLLMLMLLSSVHVSATEVPAGPVQTLIGPGGHIYNHQSFTQWEHGKQHERYFVFQPDQPALKKAGLVILLHDWFSTDPQYYAGLIRHLCRRGWIVLFPLYQGTGTPDNTWHYNAARTAKDCLLQVFARREIEIDRQRVFIIGHGAGAVLGANLAASSDYFGLPAPAGLLLLMPGRRSLKLLDLSGISRNARMIVVTGDKVNAANENTAREIFYAADRISSDNKVYITVLSDFYGQPPMIADDLAPLSPERPEFERAIVERRYEFVNMFKERFHARTLRASHIDAFDWFVIFRFFDSLSEIVEGKNPGINIFKNTPELRFMGYWSDGRRLKGLISTDRP